MIDIHSHLLPGIDDGPKTWDESLALCRSVAENGIHHSIATPHLIDGVYENLRDLVCELTEELNAKLVRNGIDLKVESGAEVDISSKHLMQDSPQLPRLADGKAVLLEMPVAVIPPALMETIFALRSRGLLPVLAHPERNEPLQDDPSLARAWVQAGAALQLDGDSLLGVWGKRTQRCGERLLDAGLFHAMASDAHSVGRRPPRLREAVETAKRRIGDRATALVEEGPALILAGKLPEWDASVAAQGACDPLAGRNQKRSLISRILRRS